MTLASRSLLSFSAAMVLTAVAGGYSLYAFDRMRDSSAAVQHVASVLDAASALEAEGLRTTLLLAQYVASPDAAKLEQLAASEASAAAARARIRELTRVPRVRALLAEYEALLPRRAALTDSIIALAAPRSGAALEARPLPDAAALRALRRDRELLEARLRPHLWELVSIQHATLTAASADAERQWSRFRGRILELSAFTIMLIGVLSLLSSRRISRRLLPLLAMANEVRRGNFKARVAVRDADEVATLSDAFNHMAADLQTLDSAKDEFVALASHQLRTPASAVKSNISALLDGYFGEFPAEQREILEDAYDSNERQLEIIDDLLNVARAETGRLAMTRSLVDLASLVDDVVAEHRLLIQKRQQTITLIRPERSVQLFADVPKLKMVLDNLISNASKYTPAGGSITVRLEARAGGVDLSVQDNGVGIAMEDHDKLFRKFSRVHNRLSIESGGTGLGLYLANEIVKLHGGAIGVRSAVNQGTTFRICLPTE